MNTQTRRRAGVVCRLALRHESCYMVVASYHSHQLRDGSVGQAKIVNHRRQNYTNAPSADRMAHPNQRESRECRIFEKGLHLGGVPCLLSSFGLSFWDRSHKSGLLVFAEEFGFRIRIVRQEEEGVYSTQDRGNAFKDKHPAVLGSQLEPERITESSKLTASQRVHPHRSEHHKVEISFCPKIL